MDIFLTGGTGYIGSAILGQLLQAGHGVTALVRSEQAADTVRGRGATPVLGDITDVGWLTEQLAAADGAIHTANPGDATAADVDAGVATAAVRAYAGTSKPYVHTSGLWLYGSGSGLDEQSPLNPPELTAWRPQVEEIVLGADVLGGVVAPAIVYGRGGGLPTLVTQAPRTAEGALTLIGDGSQHWGTVHVEDTAALYLLVLQAGRQVGRVLAVTSDAPTVRELAEATGEPVAPEPVEATRARLGAEFADALLLDQQFDNGYARSLGWTPQQPTLLAEIRSGSYAG